MIPKKICFFKQVDVGNETNGKLFYIEVQLLF